MKNTYSEAVNTQEIIASALHILKLTGCSFDVSNSQIGYRAKHTYTPPATCNVVGLMPSAGVKDPVVKAFKKLETPVVEKPRAKKVMGHIAPRVVKYRWTEELCNDVLTMKAGSTIKVPMPKLWPQDKCQSFHSACLNRMRRDFGQNAYKSKKIIDGKGLTTHIEFTRKATK